MYERIKTVIKRLIPRQFLFTYEAFFRFFFGILYIGKTKQCNICNHRLRKFIDTPTNDQLCPYCGSLSRTRRLQHILHNTYTPTGNVLHFSPARCLYRRLKRDPNITYYSSDFEDEFIADHYFDITNIPVAADFFDMIICYHILEHIVDDQQAIQELYRVLKPNGILLIQTPFREGTVYENPAVTTPEERLIHFGQEDHVRIYSVHGLIDRLTSCNFTEVSTLDFNSLDANELYMGLQHNETVIKVRK